MDRRTFLRNAALGSGAVMLGSTALSSCWWGQGAGGGLGAGPPGPGGRNMLEFAASSCPVQRIVLVMMENRSFDHWLGWMADDEQYVEAGRSAYGADFAVEGAVQQTYPGPNGPVATAHMLDQLAAENPWRGCGHPDPGHGWNPGRAERDGGFLAAGSGNDQFALGWYEGADLPFTSQLAKRFCTFDRYHASVLGPTYPNREYFWSGQSGGNKSNTLPPTNEGFQWDTIFDRFNTAGVSWNYFYSDLPFSALFGPRLLPKSSPIDDFFERCANGTLPQVSVVDPGFLTGSRTDNHPHGDIRAGEAFVRDVFAAFARSRHWRNGMFVLNYDEWGGFYDHVPPPILPDDRTSTLDADNFGQAGFRVPVVMASPYVKPGSVNHRRYDHTSILRFLEWRFLGAPPEGTGGAAGWSLTSRDRNALNIGASLITTPDPAIDIDLDVAIDPPSPVCAGEGAPAGAAATSGDPLPVGDKHSLEEAYDDGYFERVGVDTTPSPMAASWVGG